MPSRWLTCWPWITLSSFLITPVSLQGGTPWLITSTFTTLSVPPPSPIIEKINLGPFDCFLSTDRRRGLKPTVWRLGMDHDLFRIGPPYDSRCWVRDVPKDFPVFFFFLILVFSNKALRIPLLASFIPDSPEESRPCRLSGFLSCQPLSSVSNGTYGDSPWHFHITLANSLATSTTSASGMFSLGLRSEAPKSPTCYSPFINACSPPLRE